MYSKSCFILFLCLLPAALMGQSDRKISLTEALRTAIERNLDIQLQRATIESQNLNFNLTSARFEPVVTSSITTQNAEREPRSNLDGSSSFTETFEQFQANFADSFDFGLNYNVNFDSSVSNSGSAQNFSGDFFRSALSFNAEQTLLRGFSLDREIYKRDQIVASKDVDISRKDLETQISTILQQTENAYWDLVFAQEQLKVSQQSLDLAKQLYDQNKIKIEVGTMAPIELVNTEATVANRERDIIEAENRVRAAEDALKKVMNLPIEGWRKTLIPTDQLRIQALTVDEDQAYANARQHRAELLRSDLEEQKALLDIKYNKNQLRPELKLGGTYTVDGSDSIVFRDPQNPAFGIAREGSIDNSLEEVAGFEFPTYSLRLSLDWKPFNKQAKINLAQAKVGLRQAELRRQQTEINIMEEVRGAIRDLESNLKAIGANEKSVRFQEENLKAEEQKFQNGLSTNYRVSEVQDQLSQARSTLIQSKVNYLKAVVSYYKAIGSLPGERQIALQ